ncbi:MAG: tetratricopeptide repeat protein [Bacteroidetes bacterium]|nr:MAG: tetratricopeptide repeat protein [Bacteroidota bacterium]
MIYYPEFTLTDIWYFRNFYPEQELAKVFEKQQLLHQSSLLDLLATDQSKNSTQAEFLYSQALLLDTPSEKIEAYQQIVRLNPDKHEAWNNLGIAYFNQNNYAQAIDAYRKAIEIEPNFHEAWNNLGIAYFNQNNYAQAIDAYRKAIEIEPNFHEAWYNLGIAYDDIKNYAQAIDASRKAVEIKPDYYEAWDNLGVTYIYLKDWINAEKSYKKALEIKPDLHEVIYNLACLYSLQKHKEKVLSYLQQAIFLNAECKTHATKDTDFQWLWQDSDFKKMVT